MVESFELSVRSKAALEECVAWCRSPESRKCFPGAQGVIDKFGTFFYDIEVRFPGMDERRVTVEEHLRVPEASQHQISFECGLIWTWSSKEFVPAWAEYRFTPLEQGTQIDYHQRYMVPGRALSVIVNPARQGYSVKKAVTMYVEELARSAGGFL